jgi:hypothetical protein
MLAGYLTFLGSGVGIEVGSSYVAQGALELVVLLPPPPKCWDCRCAPPCRDSGSIRFLLLLACLPGGTEPSPPLRHLKPQLLFTQGFWKKQQL